MKRLQHLLLLLFTIVGVVACSYNELPEELSKMATPIETPIVLNVETRAETYDGEALDQNYFVSEADLENYVRYRRSATKQPNLTVKEVKSYGFDSSQTLFYILNYEKGWEVVSADKRVQPTLAYGDKGAFTMDCDNEPMKFWMNMLASGVLQTRQRTGDSAVATASTASKEESDKADDEEQNVAFWNVISPTQQPNSRGEILIPTPGPLNPGDTSIIVTPPAVVRRYFIPNAIVSDAQISTIGNPVATRWGQSSPWNWYCPIKMSDSLSRVPAGCTAVAGAQLLYFLRTVKGWNIDAPLVAECNAQLPNKEQSFDNFSTQPWSLMALLNSEDYSRCDNSAKLIAYIGNLCGMNYGDDGSSASLWHLQSGLASGYNISSSISVYSSSKVVEELSKNPVVVAAAQELLYQEGHSWLIDQYRVMHVETTRYYIETTELLTVDDLWRMTIEDATGYIIERSTSKHFHMNWGWSGNHDSYYGLTSDSWEIFQDGTYQQFPHILHDFTL